MILEYIPIFFRKRLLSPLCNVVECEVISIGTLFHPEATLKLGERGKFRKYLSSNILSKAVETEANTRGGRGWSRRARPPFFCLSKFFFSEQLALCATTNSTTTTTTTNIQYYRWYRSKWCPIPSILTIDLLFCLKFSIPEKSRGTNGLFLKFFCYITWFE